MGAIPATFDRDYTRGIQKTLAQKLVQPLTIDGDFGPASITALRNYQLQNGLASTGQYDAATQALIEPFLLSHFVTRQDFQSAADALAVPIAAVKAVQETETSGSGFAYTGKVRILFERHWMYKFLSAKLPALQFQKIQAANADIINSVPGGYATGPTADARSIAEYQRFSRAFAIDAGCAMKSASWGLFQIMGFNAGFAGFKNPDGSANVGPFVDAMKSNEQAQLTAFVNFIKTYNGGALWQAMKTCDWVTFARIYNGPANVAVYSQKIGTNFTTFREQYA
jgi:peptidoglycan hydrolase-like protein with peptidoglycan-binding domain